MRKVELLAPAGNYETMIGAFNAGADAVYLGGQGFGARAFADNFSNEEVIKAIRYAHLHGKKIYLTVNTLLKENEIPAFKEFFAPFAYAGLDGAIIQDFGIFKMIRDEYPWIELHVSTQMTITGQMGARLLMDLGASRVVPARELSLSEIKSIHDNCKFDNGKSVEIEAFIHGAMCYCYSGACLFSSMVGERSGNRGRCAQPCRLPYKDSRRGDCYPLSLKDMCMVDQIPALIEAGINSFKIEGRMKKPEYAAGVTSIYRKYIDKYYDLLSSQKDYKEGTIKLTASESDRKILSSLYLRSEIGEGYYFRHNSPDMITIDNPAYNGSDEDVLANIRARFLTGEKKIGIKLKCELKINEASCLTLSCDDPVKAGDVISVTVKGDIVQEAVKRSMEKEDIEKQLSKFGNTFFTVESISTGIDEKGIFIPNKALNELRRKGSAALENAIMTELGYKVFDSTGNKEDAYTSTNPEDTAILSHSEQGIDKAYDYKSSDESFLHKKNSKTPMAISVMNYSQLIAAADYFREAKRTGRIYVDSRIVLFGNDIPVIPDVEYYVLLPFILRNESFFDGHNEIKTILEKADEQKFNGIVVRNAEELWLVKKTRYKGQIILDYGIYNWNHESLSLYIEALKDMNFKGINLPLELNYHEMSDMLKHVDSSYQGGFLDNTGLMIYGRVPMMHTANCLKNTLDKCSGRRGSLCNYENISITDRTGRKLPVTYDCMHCCNIIWNSVPVSLFKKSKKLKAMANNYGLIFRLDFTIEKDSEVSGILDAYDAILYGNDKNKMLNAEKILAATDYTTGHFERSTD